MQTAFVNSLRAEWMKSRHTAAAWIVVTGAFFVPILAIVMRLTDHGKPQEKVFEKDLWAMMYQRNWTPMGMFLLPLMLILFTSLVTNLEFKNNTWKQLHTTPQHPLAIYAAKLLVVLLMMIQMFLLFNIGIWLSVVLPGLIFSDLQSPDTPYPYTKYLRGNMWFFIDCLPIVALQYLLSLKFKNFIVPVGIGFSLLVLALLALNARHGYLMPYIYVPLNFRQNQGNVDPAMNRHYWATAYFTLFIVLGYILYTTQKDRS